MEAIGNNAVSFAVASFIVQLFIVGMIAVSAQGSALLDDSTAYSLLAQQTRNTQSGLNNTGFNSDSLNNTITGLPSGDIFDPLLPIVNFGQYVGNAVSIVRDFGFDYLTLSQKAFFIPYIGWLIGSLVGLWQIVTWLLFIAFVLPRLKK